MLFWLGYLYEEIGKRNDAIALWKRGLAIDPAYSPILNSLGYIYAEEGISLDEAEKLIKKALEKEPENGSYIDSLGWVYFKKKDYANAEVYLQKANNIMRDSTIYEHLGDLYLTLNKPEEAAKYYEEGLKYFPDSKNLQEKFKKYGRKEHGRSQ
jgi:tetratricopeptide (TPR) repeat protein